MNKATIDTDIILNSIADGVFTVDLNWHITSFNRAAEEITGVTKKEALGKMCYEVFRADICETSCVLRQTMKTGKPVINRNINILRADGIKIPISVSTALIKDKMGNIIGGVETFRDLSTEEALRRELKKSYKFEEIISKNHRMQEIFTMITQVASTDVSVLIEGQSGTGKELIARAIHNMGKRKDKPFIAINCGALPENLLESELFGYKKGAFTDAIRDKPGRFALAEGGTLFLDEIGELPKPLQVKLLRVLQEKVYEPLGGVESIRSDVRIISATNKNLWEEVKKGNFREDLFYRINVVKIDIPSLEERKEDIPLLVEHFIDRYRRVYKKNITGITQEALSTLLKYNWPGNIRELENAIEYAFIVSNSSLIEKKDLPEQIRGYTESFARNYEHEYTYFPMTLEELEKKAIIEALERNHYRKLKTARELGIDKTTLWRKIKKYKIEDSKLH